MVFNKYNFKQSGGGEDEFLIYAVIIALVFFLFIMPMIEKQHNKEKKDIMEKLENVMVPLRLDAHKCSRSCCVNTGWPLPKELRDNDIPEKEMKNYISSNYSCNLGSNNGGGCVCVTKDDYELLGSRGGNGVTGCKN